ncbi:ABC transporter substrate-binding protein [Bifidobacterium xylocopae]|uniref:ABC transporter substrate-binding protein n=2 Tax=Bifidobacterium xylocopae TaxID=2493119 RepID=A0A366KCQ0_9BIFI|nr:ABC transporter substrate-binding protein [Bifidobacterium xylocopae]
MSKRSQGKRALAVAMAATALVAMSGCGKVDSSKGSGTVSIACSQQEDFCQAVTKAFAKDTGIKTTYVRLGAGEVLARLATNPGEFDVWAGGQAENHLLADDKGMIEHYAPKGAGDLAADYKDDKGAWTGFYTDSIAFCSNTAELGKKGVKPPVSWADLLDNKLKGAVAMPHPATAGVGYMAMFTQAVLHNGDKGAAIDYFKQLNPNVMQYSKSAATGTEQAGRGEVSVAIALDSDCQKAIKAGYPDLKTTYPTEGTGYEVGAISVLKGARSIKNAKAFADWMMTTQAQNLYAEVPSYAAPTNPKAKIGDGVPRQDKVKKVDWNVRQAADARDAFIKSFESDIASSSSAK